jgi:HEAT repeat protein
MTALNLILIIAGAMLAAGLLAVLAWLIYSWYLDRVERSLAERKGLYRELVSDLATRDRALLHPTIHQIGTLYDLDALEAVLEEQARSSDGSPSWLLEVYDELGLVDKYIHMLRSARKWRDRAFAAELLGRVGGAKAVPALLETVVATRTEDSDVREIALRALARIGDPGAVEPLIRALENVEGWLAPRIANILARHGEAVVAPLIALLDQGNHRSARAWAANVLGEVRAQRAFPSVVRLLDDLDDEVRAKAATALGRMGDRRAVGYLMDHLLSDPAPFVRARISAALGQLGGPEIIERLVRALGDPAWWVRMRTVEALEHVGAVAEGPLLIALDDADREIRMRAAAALERLGLPHNLVRMIESGERVPEAMQTLVKFAAAGPREFLSELTLHDSRQVRSALVTAAEQTLRRDLADDLVRMAANDPEAALRGQALTALRSLGIREALPAALNALADEDRQVRAAAVEFVGAFGSADILGLLRAQTADADPLVRAASMRALGRFGAPVGTADVGRLLHDPEWAVREAAVIAATEALLRSLLPDLITLLGDTDPRVRRRAAGAVGVLGDRSTVPLLLGAFPDPSSEVNEAIAVAVSRLDPAAVSGLAEALVDSPDVESKLALIRTVSRSQADPHSVLHRLRADPSPAVRAAALDSLSRRTRRSGEGPESVVPALESGIKDPDELVRATAVDAWSRQATLDQAQLLLTLLKQDSSPLVRERAALSIGLLRLSAGEASLIAALRRAEPANVRAAATLAAGVFDTESMVARIMDMPDDAAVREILRERLKWDSRFRLLRSRLSKARHLELHALMMPSSAEAQAALAGGTRKMLDAGDRVRLISSLRAFSGEPSREALLQMVRSDPIPEVRTAAIAGVSDLLEEAELLATGARALGDPSPLVRRAAVELFARARAESALPRLIQALKPDDEPAVLAAAAALAEEHFGEFAMVVRALAPDGERATLALRIARYVVHPELPAILPRFARSESPDVRDAVTILWKNRPDVADTQSLQALTEDPDTAIRRHAAGAALASGRYDLLKSMTRDPDPSVRREIAHAMARGESVERPGVATLELLATDTDMSVRAAAYVARLLQGTPLALPPELDAQMAAQAVHEIVDLSRLRQTARTSPSEERRLAAALVLALVQDDVAQEVARTDPAPAIRHRVAGALELSGRSLGPSQ